MKKYILHCLLFVLSVLLPGQAQELSTSTGKTTKLEQSDSHISWDKTEELSDNEIKQDPDGLTSDAINALESKESFSRDQVQEPTKALNESSEILKKTIQASADDGDELTITKITRFVRVSGVIFSITLIVVVVMLLRLMHRLVERFSIQIPQKRMLFHKIETIAQFFIYVGLAISIFLLSFRINEQLLSIIGGTVAVSFGFAIKDLIASFIAGLMIMIDRPFQVGDRITFDGQYGDITAIGLRSVRMQTLSDDTVTIPNNKFLSDVTVCGNYGELSMQMTIDFYIGLDQDIEKACEIVNEATSSSHYICLPKPVVVLVKQVIIESYMAYRVRVKAYVLDIQYEAAFETDLNLRIMKAFKTHEIHPPSILHRNN
ncbi:mechanosensitive ion channel [Lentisphaera marina]|uniref:mechanosensitive ion channel family protein n=1 Tax=Lentisphaera marina TaxID=1111041 RepID=UPI00236730C7|nr:mechanosensitive ion channel domain-containing protein [Lentisphaera marina]MDD7986303.1 mechanosensitive ion channel [Lentisphaera marina]